MNVSPRHSIRGSAILFALVVLTIGGMLLAAWIQVLANRALYSEQLNAAVRRRIVLENSRALATQYLLEKVMPASHSTAVSASIAEGWGAFAVAASVGGVPLTPLESVVLSAGNNPFSPGSDAGYTVDLPVTLSDGHTDQVWLFQARSRSPIFGPDLLTLQRPTLNSGSPIQVSTGIGVQGGAMLWVPNSPNAYGMTVTGYQTPAVTLPSVSLLNSSGSSVHLSNFAFLPLTSGNGYTGLVSTVNPIGTVNSLTARVLSGAHIEVDPLVVSNIGGVMSDGAGNVTIDLLEAGLMRVFISGNTTTLRLKGHLAADWLIADDRPALLVSYVQTASTSTRDLTTIELQNESNRRFYLAVKKNTGTSVSLTTTALGTPLRWRFAASLENTPAFFSLLGGSLRLQGGIRSDQSIQAVGGTVSLVREQDPKLLERFGDRNAWLESYRQ